MPPHISYREKHGDKKNGDMFCSRHPAAGAPGVVRPSRGVDFRRLGRQEHAGVEGRGGPAWYSSHAVGRGKWHEPGEESHMERRLVLDVPEEVYGPLADSARRTGATPEQTAVAWLLAVSSHAARDPLEKFTGAFPGPGPDGADRDRKSVV